MVVYWCGVWPAATIASFEERLILLVCWFACLYDVENCSHIDAEKKRNAWEYIAKHIDASGKFLIMHFPLLIAIETRVVQRLFEYSDNRESMLMIEYKYSSMLRSLDCDLSTGQVRATYKSAAPRHTMFILSTLDLDGRTQQAK